MEEFKIEESQSSRYEAPELRLVPTTGVAAEQVGVSGVLEGYSRSGLGSWDGGVPGSLEGYSRLGLGDWDGSVPGSLEGYSKSGLGD